MARFLVSWKNGKSIEMEKSDCLTVSQFVNAYFGRSVDPAIHGAEVMLMGVEDAEVVEAPVAKPKKAKK